MKTAKYYYYTYTRSDADRVAVKYKKSTAAPCLDIPAADWMTYRDSITADHAAAGEAAQFIEL